MITVSKVTALIYLFIIYSRIYLVFCLLHGNVSMLDCVVSNGMMINKLIGNDMVRNCQGSLRYYPAICLEELKNSTKIFSEDNRSLDRGDLFHVSNSY